MAGLPLTLSLMVIAVLAASSVQAEPATGGPAVSPKRERIVSSRLASAILDTLPKYDSVKAAAPPPAPEISEDPSRNAIVRLPSYIVRESRPPSAEDILTEKGREAAMARRYLGPQTNLDRSLNSVTLTDLWKSIPILGRIPFVPFASLTYDQRAALIYEETEKRRRFGELLNIEQLARAAEPPAAATKPIK